MSWYLDLDCDGLAIGLGPVELMSMNPSCLELAESDGEHPAPPPGGAFMLRWDFPGLGGMLWLDARGPELTTYRRGALAPRLSLSHRDDLWLLDEPTEADLAEAEAWLAVDELFSDE